MLPRQSARVADRTRLSDHKLRLGFVIGHGDDMDRIAALDRAPEVFRAAAGVVFDETVRGGEDLVGAAVILLEPDDLGIGKMFFELEDVRDLRAAPPVDALVVISHHANIGRFARGQEAHQIELKAVRILELIHEHLGKPRAPFFADGWVVVQEFHRLHEEVVEIHGVQSVEFAVVAGIDRADHGLVILRRGPAIILGFADEVFREAGVELFVLRRHAVDDLFDEPELVALVENREIVFVSELVGIGPENPHAEGVEGRGRDIGRLLLGEHSGDSLLHLAGGLVGERDGENFRGWRPGGDQPSDARNDRAGFSRSRAGEDQQGAGLVGGGALLLGVEIIESEAGHGEGLSPLRRTRSRFRCRRLNNSSRGGIR